MTYPIALAVISLAVAFAEWRWPWRKAQKQLRPHLLSDAIHLVFNGHFLGLLLFGLFDRWVFPSVQGLASSEAGAWVFRSAAAEWPLWVQIPVALVVIDFGQWCVHNALHRVPFLWDFHKTHHSVVDGEMDWIVSFRFQWTEVVVYKSLLYLPLAFFGFSGTAVFVHAVFGTLIGHLNHANLNLDYGPLKYVLNHPKMHIWHHDYAGDRTSTVNFGIIFSTWDFLFGTAKISDAPPARLGFDGVETFPTDFFRQAAWPLRWPSARAPRFGKLATGAAGAGVLSLGFVLIQPAPPSTPMLGEVAASSQPASRGAFDYPNDDDEAARAVTGFGEEASAAGFALPEAMVSVDELARAIGAPGLVVVDVRPAERFHAGHIPGALPVERPDFSSSEPIPGLTRPPEALAALLARLGHRGGGTLVLYGDGGPEPYRLWWSLRSSGVADARLLDGGLRAWKLSGHGVAEGPGRAPTPGARSPGAVTPVRNGAQAERLWADLAPFRERTPQLVDTRSELEHTGAEKHKKAARAGRIPGSLHLDWVRILDERTGALLLPEGLRAVFADAGVDVGRPILTWCQSGTRSAAVYFALLQLGVEESELRNYDGSWAEYSRLAALDVESGPKAIARAP